MSKQSEELAALKKKVEELEAKVSPPKSDFKPMTDAEWRDQMHQAAERRMSLAIPRALLAPGTSTVWPTSTTTRNEARAQLSEPAWLALWARCCARNSCSPAASSVMAITTPSFVAARHTPVMRPPILPQRPKINCPPPTGPLMQGQGMPPGGGYARRAASYHQRCCIG